MDDGPTTRAPATGYLQPALMGGLVSGVLSALPVISAGNVCCCLWVVAGGLTAAYLLQQNRDVPISAADGALVGLLAGVIGAGGQFLLAIPIGLLIGPFEREMAGRIAEVSGSMPPATREALEAYARGSESGFIGVLLLRIIGLFVTLVVGAVVSTVAGVVGAALFARAARGPRTA